MKIKKSASLFMILVLLFLSLSACGGPSASDPDPGAKEPIQAGSNGQNEADVATRAFTDSLGRSFRLPAEISSVALSGTAAQITLFALCPHKIAGLADDWSREAADYLDAAYLDLPVLGQLYGGKAGFNAEALLASGAQIVLDVGEPKDGLAEDLDGLQEQLGIPVIHIDSSTETAGDCFRKLGELFGMEEEAEALAAYYERVCGMMLSVAETADKKDLLYITGSKGLNVIAKGSYHSEIIDLLSRNAAVLDTPSSKGTGNEVDMEALLQWDPQVILFAPDSIYDSAADDPLWQKLKAIQTGRYYEVPCGPHNWMGNPPSVQRLPGMLWMCSLLYPDQCAFDLRAEVKEFYKLFYHCDLRDEQYDALVSHSLGKQER